MRAFKDYIQSSACSDFIPTGHPKIVDKLVEQRELIAIKEGWKAALEWVLKEIDNETDDWCMECGSNLNLRTRILDVLEEDLGE